LRQGAIDNHAVNFPRRWAFGQIVEDSLADVHRPGMTAQELYETM
jgi:hypothetical protein